MFGFGNRVAQPPKAICKVSHCAWGHDHEIGDTKLSVSAVYASKANSYRAEAVYKIDNNFKAYGALDLDGTTISHVGVDGKVEFGDQKVNTDVSYNLGKDSLCAKVAVPIEDIKLIGHVKLDGVKKDALKNHSEAVEAIVNLSNDDSAELLYDITAKSLRARYSRVLDDKNTVRAEYTFVNKDNHSGTVRLTHKADSRNTFEVDADLGKRNYSLKWKQDTEKGRWTVKTTVPFDSNPKDGELSIKRRFDISL